MKEAASLVCGIESAILSVFVNEKYQGGGRTEAPGRERRRATTSGSEEQTSVRRIIERRGRETKGVGYAWRSEIIHLIIHNNPC